MPSKVQQPPTSPGLINQRCEKCGALRHVEPYRQDGNPDGILLCYFCSPDAESDRAQAQEAPGTPANRLRADKARKALKDYFLGNTNDEAIVDLLADLRHLCARQGRDFDDLNRMAESHYLAEKGWTK